MSRLRPLLLLLPFVPVSAALAAPLTEADALRGAVDTHASIQPARSALIAARGIQAEADFLLPGNPALRVERTTDRDLSRSQAEYQLAVNKARRELAQAESGWRAAWQQWQDAEEALRLTSETLALIEMGFTVGEVSSVDLIQEKRRWGEAVEANRSAAAAVAIAKAAWEQASGTTPIPVQ